MAHEIMYEGDGFIRKGPKPKETVAEESRPAVVSKRKWRGGITMFHLIRLIFNH